MDVGACSPLHMSTGLPSLGAEIRRSTSTTSATSTIVGTMPTTSDGHSRTRRRNEYPSTNELSPPCVGIFLYTNYMGFVIYGEKEKKYMHEWYLKNKARRNAYFKEWYQNNKEEHLRKIKEKREENKYKTWYEKTYLKK
jgi:hypothetical protein